MTLSENPKRNVRVMVMSYHLRRHYDVKMRSMSFQQLRYIIMQQIKPQNKSFNLNGEILSKFGMKFSSTLL